MKKTVESYNKCRKKPNVNIRFGNEKEKVAQKLLIMTFDDQ